MLPTMNRVSAPSAEGDDPLDLPPLDGEDEHEGLDDPSEIDLRLPDQGEETDEADRAAEPMLGIRLEVGQPAEPSALGDDATGLDEAPPTLGLCLDERGESLLEREAAEPGSVGEEAELGLEPLPEHTDRSDAEGLEDPTGERLDDDELPVLDVGGDEEEVEVGIEIEPPAAGPGEPARTDSEDEEG
jgi:hypothetical protein